MADNQKTQKFNSNSQPQKPSTNTFKKKRGKKKGHKNQQVVVKVYGPPVREYVSLCHGATAKKPRTGISTAKGGAVGTSDPTAVYGLGGWRCSECNKPCKVKAQKPQPKEEIIVNQ